MRRLLRCAGCARCADLAPCRLAFLYAQRATWAALIPHWKPVHVVMKSVEGPACNLEGAQCDPGIAPHTPSHARPLACLQVGCGTTELGDRPWLPGAPAGYFSSRIRCDTVPAYSRTAQQASCCDF